MTSKEVINILEKNKNERGIASWKKLGTDKFDSFGIGLTQLKSIGKKIGKNHNLALELWKTKIYDAKLISIIIDDPKLVTEEQVDKQVKELEFWIFSHVYCTVLMPKLPFLKKKTDEWTKSKNNILKRCGYLCLYELAKIGGNLEDKYFETFLNIIEKKLQSEENFVKDAMNNSLLAIGMRNKSLNKKAVAIAKKIGKVTVDYGETSCQALDCIKHLTSDRVQKGLK